MWNLVPSGSGFLMELGNYLLSDNDIEECQKKINRLKNIIIENKLKEKEGNQDLQKISNEDDEEEAVPKTNVTDDWKLESKETETKVKQNSSDDMKTEQAKGDEGKDMQKEMKVTEESDKTEKKETIVNLEKKAEQGKGDKTKDMQKKLKEVTKLRRKRQ